MKCVRCNRGTVKWRSDGWQCQHCYASLWKSIDGKLCYQRSWAAPVAWLPEGWLVCAEKEPYGEGAYLLCNGREFQNDPVTMTVAIRLQLGRRGHIGWLACGPCQAYPDVAAYTGRWNPVEES